MAGTVVAGQKLTSALLGIPPWTAMSLSASWVNFGSGFTTAQYRLWPLINEVELIGTISGGTATNGTVIFTLPSGYIPASTTNNPVNAGTSTNPYFQVNTLGQIVLNNIGASQVISFHFWVSLDA